MVQPGQDRNAYHLGSFVRSCMGRSRGVGKLLLDPLMRSCLVEGGHIGIEHKLKLLRLKDQQVIEAFSPHAPQKAFADGIGSWSLNRRLKNLDATCGRHTSKARSEFAIVVSNQILR
jgi:hypothetical protein